MPERQAEAVFSLSWSALGLIITPWSTVRSVLFTNTGSSCLIHNCIFTYQMHMHERTAVKTPAMKCLAWLNVQQQPPCRCAWATMNTSPAHWLWTACSVQSDDDKSTPLLQPKPLYINDCPVKYYFYYYHQYFILNI